MKIHQALERGDFPNATQLAAELETSTKTIHRDIEFMRDRLGLPIEFDFPHNGYHYTQEVAAFPTLQITEGELFALVVAEKALEQYRGTNFEKPLLSAIRKVADSLPDTITIEFGELGKAISFHTRAEPVLDLGIFRTLAEAVTHCRQLRLQYRKPGGRPPEERVVDPYHLGNINGEWYLFAFDHLRKDLRTFVPMRVLSAAPTGKSFVRPRKFSLADRLRGSFGVVQGSGSHTIVLRFNALVADLIREKKWHDSQRLEELPDGGVKVTFALSSLSEVERWVLSWGANCLVLQPPELVDSVRRAAQGILAANRPD